ncbi:MAG: transposase [Candidatus Omnitrophica bacterium]|nr:transposase [Candidatus Omnitrophota bacterium]
MKDIDRVLELRKNMMEDWRYRSMHWKDITYKYRVSKEWFYKLRKRFIEKGYEGLKDKVRNNSNRPRRIGLEEKLRILDYIYENPTHGVDRIAWDFIPHISHRTLWKFLKKEDLNTRHKRRLWAESQGKRVLTKKERLIRSAKHNHVESHAPGELVSIDTLTVSVKGLGKIWHYTACDTYSSYGWIKAYHYKTSDNAIDFFINHIFKNVPSSKIKRILTDQGTEFYNFKNKENDSSFTNALRAHGVQHTVTKVAHPWTNGYVERLNQTSGRSSISAD